MKKVLLTLVMSLALCGMGFAQYESHWPDFYYPTYGLQSTVVAAIQIDGQIITADYPTWDALEVAFFVGDECRGAGVEVGDYDPAMNYLYNGYVEDFGDPYPTLDGTPVYYTSPGDAVTVKMYDHINGIEYTECVVTYLGEPYTIVTGTDHIQGWYDTENPIFLCFTSPEPPTPFSITKDIVGYGEGNYDSNIGYYLIASPIEEAVTPSEDNGFLTSEFDLYFFDHNVVGEEWQNYKDTDFLLTSGKGYLYASQDDTQLTFTGTAYSGDGVIELTYTTDVPDFGGWNLVGNPFPVAAGIDREDYYILNGNGSELMEGSGDIPAMEGVFVIAEQEGETVTFSPSDGVFNPNPALTLNIGKADTRGIIDRAVIRFNEGRLLPKFQMNPSHTKVYIPQDGKDYAVVRAAKMGELPVNFMAETCGTYTMNFSSENVEFSYLHLIDNMTGADIDLLASPSYTFNANWTDYESRFKLVFICKDAERDNDSFAFYSNGSWIIDNEGEATVQVIDVNGRILKNENINGCANVNVNAATGVYLIRLVNGKDVKTQKVVVR